MDTRVLLFLVIIGSCWYAEARDLTLSEASAKNVIVAGVHSCDELSDESQHVEVGKNEQLCLVCEKFAAEAFIYLSENKTQTQIIDTFHKYCSQVPSFKQQCFLLVDYYAPLFFLNVDSIQPRDFCGMFGLCKGFISLHQRLSNDKCDICHDFVSEALLKLKDPDTELEIVQLLLKACDSIGKSVKKCKTLVFEYAPLILVNTEHFLETSDICAVLHACESAAAVGSREVLVIEDASMYVACILRNIKLANLDCVQYDSLYPTTVFVDISVATFGRLKVQGKLYNVIRLPFN